jgi:ABC-type dipeptide/oligopeptide/nickel transport system ATPase subunit
LQDEDIQVVFQISLVVGHPRLTAGTSWPEPLDNFESPSQRPGDPVAELLEMVGLPPADRTNTPSSSAAPVARVCNDRALARVPRW